MKGLAPLIRGILGTFGFSWLGLILIPNYQIGHLDPQMDEEATDVYPLPRSGMAERGRHVYVANGCAYCHSQQVYQSATVCEVRLTEAGTNQPALVSALLQLRPGVSEVEAKQWLTQLPKTVLQGVKIEAADAVVKSLRVGDAKAELWIVPVGPDIERGWGKRRTVAEDFLYDYPVMLGALRIGPDLANVGERRPDANWHLRHLYAPRLEVENSAMPPYRFLFETHRIERAPSPDALMLPASLAPPPGYEIVPKPEAKALVGYLASLRADAPLFVAPLTVPPLPPAETNAPAAAAGTTNASPASPPPK